MHLFPKISLSIIAAVCAVISQTNYLRPLPPQIESVTVNSSNEVTIQIEPVRSDSFTDYKYHAVLVSDLSISLEKAFEAGKDKQRDTWISGTINSSNVLFSFPCKDSTRYYVAVRSSGKRVGPASGDERINSGWNLFIDSSSGVPLTVATGRQEGVSAQAHYLYRNSLNSGLDKAVGFFSFALKSPTNCSFEFKQNNTVLISIDNLGAITNGSSLYKYGNISEAISAGNTDMKYMVLVRPNGDTTFFNVFALLENLNPADSLIYKLKSVPTNKIVSEGDIKIAVNSGLEDIINTSYQLCRLPSSDVPVNPITATNHSTVTDSTLIRFLFSAIARLSLAHNSPKSNENEENAGIFTNYIQYFDYLVRNWNDIDNAGPGLPRLRSIYNSICDLNKGIIIDPVWTKNHGTLSEFGKPVSEQERKNYAFYEGYTRLNLDLEKPGYSAGQNTGAGIMFRISDNIELYQANLVDTFNMFGDPFIQGGDTARRIIIPANDTLLGKFNTDGLWVKGVDISQGEKSYYTGAAAVRLPLQAFSSIRGRDAFEIEGERKGMEDPVGKLVGGPEKSIMQVYEISFAGNDTLRNAVDPNNMLHRQTRRIEIDSVYLQGGSTSFKLETGDEDKGKMWLKDQTEHGVTLVDTAFTVDDIKLLGQKIINYLEKEFTTEVFEKKFSSKIIALPGGSEQRYDFDGKAYAAIDREKFEMSTVNMFLKRSLRENGIFSMYGVGRLKVHTTGNLGMNDIIWSADVNNNRKMEWEEFRTTVLDGPKGVDSLWLEFKYVPAAKYDFYFRYIHKTKNEWKKEEHVSLDVGNEYTRRFTEINDKIAELCDCKSGTAQVECREEASMLTKKYFEMWGKYANADDSWGLQKSRRRCQIYIDDDIKHGWMCYHWAYHIQEELSSLQLKHFVVQKSSYMYYEPDDPTTPENEEDYIVYHSWVTIFSCSPSVNRDAYGGLHLDPWMDTKIKVFTPIEHEARMLDEICSSCDGKRTFVASTLDAKEYLVGNFIFPDGSQRYLRLKVFGGNNDW